MTIKTVNIHGKEYMPVSERVRMAHDELKAISIVTEIVSIPEIVVFKATITTPKGTFTGFSAANPAKLIEKLNPYEVAETSAVGRALGFAGYGIVEGIASADEMVKSEIKTQPDTTSQAKPTAAPTSDAWKSNKISTKQLGMIWAVTKNLEMTNEEAHALIKDNFHVESSKELTAGQASELITILSGLKKKEPEEPMNEDVEPSDLPF